MPTMSLSMSLLKQQGSMLSAEQGTASPRYIQNVSRSEKTTSGSGGDGTPHSSLARTPMSILKAPEDKLRPGYSQDPISTVPSPAPSVIAPRNFAAPITPNPCQSGVVIGITARKGTTPIHPATPRNTPSSAERIGRQIAADLSEVSPLANPGVIAPSYEYVSRDDGS
jgi:hypothetical protein